MKQEIKQKSRRRSLLRMLVYLSNKSGDPDESFSAGLVGLAKAIKYWEPDKGTEFTTFAYRIIKQCISALHSPRQKLAKKIENIQRLFYLRTGSQLQPEQLASLIDEDAATIHDLLNNNRNNFLSLEQLLYDEEIDRDYTFVDNDSPLPEEAGILDKNFVVEAVRNFLQELPDKERSLLTLYFGINQERPATQEEIAALFGVSYQRVQQWIKKILEKLSSNRKLEELYVEA